MGVDPRDFLAALARNKQAVKPRAERFTGPVSAKKRQRLAAMTSAEAEKWPARRTFVIPGMPVGKPRQTRRDKWLKPARPCVAAYRAWADAAREAAGTLPPPELVTRLEVVARFPIPKSRTDVQCGDAYKQTPDGDNCVKSVADALWKRDEALGDLLVARRWCAGEGCTEVTIYVEGGYQQQ
jgi:Holliday junction resolvase RusA-like endonuclease